MTYDPYSQQQPQYQPQQPQSQPQQAWPPRDPRQQPPLRRIAQPPPDPRGPGAYWTPQQQPPQYPPPGHRQPPRKRRKGGIIAAIIGAGVVLVIAIAAAASGGKTPAPAASNSTPAVAPAVTTAAAPAVSSKITYRVTGSSADVQYGPAGSSYQAKVPLNETDKIGAKPAVYYAITAQLNGGGSVTCEILIDGTVISKSTATGGYNLADCEVSQDPFSGGWSDTNSA